MKRKIQCYAANNGSDVVRLIHNVMGSEIGLFILTIIVYAS